jgi:1-acyl-sn-glycerol-3-phosphate acyltransferase
MPDQPSSPPKPISEVWRPELVRLPRLTWWRRLFRWLVRGLMKGVVWAGMRAEIRGLEHFPRRGPALIVINHLGDADAALLLAALPLAPDALGKIELYDFPVLGKLMEWYGIIWVHRGRVDRRALRAALDGLAEGRMILVAPEGRYSLIGGLEEGADGAAFLAQRAGVPVVPVALVGTENANVYGHLRRLRRPAVALRVGEPFYLTESASRPAALRAGTEKIMRALAALLPEEYRGVYRHHF